MREVVNDVKEERKGSTEWCQRCLSRRVNVGYRNCLRCKRVNVGHKNSPNRMRRNKEALKNMHGGIKYE